MSTKKITQTTVYCKLGTTKETCDLGHVHDEPIYAKKSLTPTGETYIDDNGYTQDVMGIFVDYQKRLYKEHRTFDMGQQFFTRQNDKTFWEKKRRVILTYC